MKNSLSWLSTLTDHRHPLAESNDYQSLLSINVIFEPPLLLFGKWFDSLWDKYRPILMEWTQLRHSLYFTYLRLNLNWIHSNAKVYWQNRSETANAILSHVWMSVVLLSDQIKRKYLVVVGKFIANPRFFCMFIHLQ